MDAGKEGAKSAEQKEGAVPPKEDEVKKEDRQLSREGTVEVPDGEAGSPADGAAVDDLLGDLVSGVEKPSPPGAEAAQPTELPGAGADTLAAATKDAAAGEPAGAYPPEDAVAFDDERTAEEELSDLETLAMFLVEDIVRV